MAIHVCEPCHRFFITGCEPESWLSCPGCGHSLRHAPRDEVGRFLHERWLEADGAAADGASGEAEDEGAPLQKI